MSNPPSDAKPAAAESGWNSFRVVMVLFAASSVVIVSSLSMGKTTLPITQELSEERRATESDATAGGGGGGSSGGADRNNGAPARPPSVGAPGEATSSFQEGLLPPLQQRYVKADGTCVGYLDKGWRELVNTGERAKVKGYDAEAMRVFRAKNDKAVEGGVSQSSKRFHDFDHKVEDLKPWKLPPLNTAPFPHPPAPQKPPCDPGNYDFSRATDVACLAFMRDLENWESIVPLPSVLEVARTIKFKVTFKNGQNAMMKLSQSKFRFEPYSEFFSYLVDRELGFNKVPPVAWVVLPKSWIQSVSSTIANPLYAQWVEQFMFQNKYINTAVKERCPFQQDTVGVSVQLWMGQVGPFFESKLYSTRTALAGRPLAKKLTAQQKKDLGDYSDLVVFDYLIANTDRTRKNTFAGPNRLLAIDNGGCFYSRSPDVSTPLRLKLSSKTVYKPKYCAFRKATRAKVLSYMPATEPWSVGALQEKINQSVNADAAHTGFWDYAEDWQLYGLQSRVRDIKRVFDYCSATFPQSDTILN
eukprot:Rhum_TRINITY_DN13782_c0_g1::Rhum_TRINITY_DN13782_c0_g1_i1::g.64339::m.64339